MNTNPDITNAIELRPQLGVCLRPTGNMQESYKFMLLTTGKNIVWRKFTKMPVPKSVVIRVNNMAEKEKSGSKNGLSFKKKKWSGVQI